MHHPTAVALALAVLAAVAVSAAAQAPGQALFAERGCAGCHGEDGGPAVDSIPVLAGQRAAYLFKQARDIGEGRRVSRTDANGDPRTRPMKDSMAGVSDADLQAIADWLATVPAPPAARGDAAAAADGAELFDEFGCIGCHGDGGRKPLSDYPILAGQNRDYLALQLKDIRDDVRTNGRSRLMIGFARPLTDAQAERIAEHLSQADRTGP